VQLRKLMLRVQRNDLIYLYYCGHGLSNKSGEQLILPYDGMPDSLDSQNTIKIERMYSKFLNSKASRTFSLVTVWSRMYSLSSEMRENCLTIQEHRDVMFRESMGMHMCKNQNSLVTAN